MRLVLIESPYAGATPDDVDANVAYARRALRDCLLRNEAPLASHVLYTQPGVLDDLVPEERALGIQAGLAWGASAEATVAYVDRGLSPGMIQGIRRALSENRPVEARSFQHVGRDLRSVLYELAERAGFVLGSLVDDECVVILTLCEHQA